MVAMLRRVVLVHGAWHGAWCWEQLVPRLQARGFEVSTLDLPGLGADRTSPWDVTLDGYIERVLQVIASAAQPVMLLGHSMGGMAISGAAERRPESIGKLIYLAAMLPVNGESALLASGAGAGATGAGPAFMLPDPANGVMTVDPALAPQIFYNCCTPEVATRATERLRPQALGLLDSPLALSPSRYGLVAKTYIRCLRDQALAPAQQLLLCGRYPELRQLQMDTDHSPFYSDPDGLASLLYQEAQ
jgi:pimeloyl-ACP methyl ester carboxylesterase